MKRSAKSLFALLLLASFLRPFPGQAATNLAASLKGRILLQVEAHGEAWYVNPGDLKRYYLGRPADAFDLMKRLSLGISNRDFAAFGGRAPARLSGRILLKVEDSGKAYYVYPVDLKLYYLGRPADAFNIMRSLGLGITNRDLESIPKSIEPPVFSVLPMEKDIFDLVNAERIKNGLGAAAWSDVVAEVAREHSENLARDNRSLIDNNRLCSYPFIHHEGVDFGLYHNDRLNSRGVYDFSSSAENIALIPAIYQTEYLDGPAAADCQAELNSLNRLYEEKIEAAATETEKIGLVKSETAARAGLLARSPAIKIVSSNWYSQAQVETRAVEGWMGSPGHRANILNGAYDRSGIGIARVNDYFIITQVFVKIASCGYRGGPCCEKPGYLPYCFVPLDCQNNFCNP